MAMQEHCLKALGCYLEYARRATQELLLLFLRHVAMPMPHVDVALAADVVETRELVVDKGLERRYVETAHCGRRILLQERDDGENAASVLPDAVDAESRTLASELKMASPAAAWIARSLLQPSE